MTVEQVTQVFEVEFKYYVEEQEVQELPLVPLTHSVQ